MTRVLVRAFVGAVCVRCLRTRNLGVVPRGAEERNPAARASDFLPFPEARGDTRTQHIFFFPPQLSFPYIRVCKLHPCSPPDDSSWALEWVPCLLFSIPAFQQLTSAVLNAENSAQNNDRSVPARLTPYLLYPAFSPVILMAPISHTEYNK